MRNCLNCKPPDTVDRRDATASARKAGPIAYAAAAAYQISHVIGSHSRGMTPYAAIVMPTSPRAVRNLVDIEVQHAPTKPPPICATERRRTIACNRRQASSASVKRPEDGVMMFCTMPQIAEAIAIATSSRSRVFSRNEYPNRRYTRSTIPSPHDRNTICSGPI